MSLNGGRAGITIEADQRPVSELLKDLELDRANHSATPCDVERKNKGNTRRDERKGGNRCGQGQTQTKHEGDGMGDGDDIDRPQMARDDDNEYRSQVRVIAGMLCDGKGHQCVTCNVSRESEDTSLGSREQNAGSAGSRVVSWKRIQTPTGDATKPLDDQCQQESS